MTQKNFRINARHQHFTHSLASWWLLQVNELNSLMTGMYSTATVCDRPGDDDPSNCYPLDPGLLCLAGCGTNHLQQMNIHPSQPLL